MERRGDTTGIGAETSQLPNRCRDDRTGPDLQQSGVRFGGVRIADMPRPVAATSPDAPPVMTTLPSGHVG
ncbi:hypothetical protein [Nocardia nova]|jgi:hypothetical protein|uniref:hypothetical protein n=1 Tax=Nocardia nova TaxID=37330 RepID=UPI001895E30F|nr:hypothetical protein [Nocardia nova]MBF6146775.1 hypothetical protein [Nocardia nova]MDN2499572.1 hypothetical protein [Nocardia nova]